MQDRDGAWGAVKGCGCESQALYVHGRIGTLVIYDFYLKIILGFTVFWYTILTGFSAQTLFDDGYLVPPLPLPDFLHLVV